MDLAGFRLMFPEFVSCDNPLIQQYLDAAALQLNVIYWGTWYDKAHGFKTAHMLCLAPNGQMSRLVAKDGSTTYGRQFEELQGGIAFGDRVF